MISATMPAGWVHNKLRTGKAIVLLDGVDEISEREKLYAWLNELVATFPDAIYLITSRPGAADEELLQQSGFNDAELLPMDSEDIGYFIDHWHEALLENLSTTDQTEVQKLASKLKRILQENRPIRSLATNPLLCALICALHRDRYQHLPTDRIELYEACCHMLLERRDIEREISLKQYPRLQYRKKLTLLEDLAYHLLINGWSEITFEKALERLRYKLPSVPGLPSRADPINVLQMFLERSGLLREPITGQVDFAHRTFLEYLAAREAVKQGNIGVLLNHAHLEHWRETVILAAGIATPAQQTELIEGLLVLGDANEQRKQQLHLLAIACLETITSINPRLSQTLNERLSQLIPPRNFTEAKALASAGDLAVPHLARCTNHNATLAAAAVRALALIGTDSALGALEAFGKDYRQTVLNEVVRAWDYFDRNEFSERIGRKLRVESLSLSRLTQDLPTLPTVIKVSLREISVDTEFDVLQCFPNLAILQISSVSPSFDIRRLGSLSGLRQLIIRLEEFRETDLDWLANLKDLEFLTLDGLSGTLSLPQVTALKSLRWVNIFASGELVVDIGSIVSAPKLKTLQIFGQWGTPIIVDTTSTSKNETLTELSLESVSRIVGGQSLMHLHAIRSVRLTGPMPVEDLAQLPDTETLELNDLYNIKDLSFLSEMRKLHSLTIQGCYYLEDLSTLNSLPALRRVSLNFCPTANVATLTDFDVITPEGRVGLTYALRKSVTWED